MLIKASHSKVYRSVAVLVIALLYPGLTSAGSVPEECLTEWGEVAPNAEEMIGQLQSALANDKFIHRGYISPVEFRLLDKRKLAEMLVARLDEECERPRTAPDAIPVNSEIIMMVPDRNLPLIAKYGFQNQHLTGSTNGCNCAGERYRHEQGHMLMQMPYSNKAREVLPKYSAFNLRTSDAGSFLLPSNYGNVALVFKPQVNRRSTFTFTDSLGINDDGVNDFPPRTLNYKRKKADDPQCSYGYCEAQIWGPLELGDVAYAMIKKGAPIPDSVKKAGLAVYEYDEPLPDTTSWPPKIPATKGTTAQYRRGALLQGASPAHTYSPPVLSRAELEKRSEAASDLPALRSILESRLLEKYSDKELIEKHKEESSKGDTKPEFPWMAGPMNLTKKLVAEIAARPITPEIRDFLLSQRNHEDPEIRAQALMGLSDLPPAILKPYLQEALKDKNSSVRQLAIAIAVDSSDPDLRASAKNSAYEWGIGKFYDRLVNPKLCGPTPSPAPFSKTDGKGGVMGAGGGFGISPYAPAPSPGPGPSATTATSTSTTP